MNQRSIAVILIALLGIAAAPTSGPIQMSGPATTQPGGVKPISIDARTLLGDPPAIGSEIQQAEIAHILAIQAARTPADEKRCQDEVHITAFVYADAIGPWFTEKNLPIAAQVMSDAMLRASAANASAKAIWNRPRPPVTDARVKPCIPVDPGGSYPSAQATGAMLWATLLSAIFPDKSGALIARAHQLGDDRVLAGVHYPSDIAAGEKLGAEVARQLLADERFKTALARARAECLTAANAATATTRP